MRFRVFGIPVYVSTAFLVTAALFGIMTHDARLGVSAVVIIFFAVLVHELGHAIVARAFGAEPAILLHGFGGTTSFRGIRLPRTRSILTTLAGPGAGFLLGVVCFVVEIAVHPAAPFWRNVLKQAYWCTFGWGLINLLPVLPLDGGAVLRDVLGPRHARLALFLSGIFGLLLAAGFAAVGMLFATLLFGLSTVQSLRAAWSYGELEAEEAARAAAANEQLDAGARSFENGRIGDAETKATAALALALDPAVRDRARRLLAAIAIDRGDGMRAVHHVGAIEERQDHDDVLLAQALDVAGERDAAFHVLERRAAEKPTGPALGALLRGLLAVGATDRAIELGRSHAASANVEALAELAGDLFERGELDAAASLYARLFDRTGNPTFAYEAARARSRIGDRDGTFAMLEAALLAGFGDASRLASDAALDPVRDDPRFVRLVARLPAS